MLSVLGLGQHTPGSGGGGGGSGADFLINFDGTSGGTPSPDESGNSIPILYDDAAALADTAPLPVNAATYLNIGGSTDAARVTSDLTPFQFGSDDFTIEHWFYGITSTRRYHCGLGDRFTSLGEVGWAISNQFSQIQFDYSLNGSATLSFSSASSAFTSNSWTYVAIQRSGTTLEMWVDGGSRGSTTIGASDSLHAASGQFTIGTWFFNNAWNNGFAGRYGPFRVTKGSALFTSGATTIPVPSTIFPT